MALDFANQVSLGIMAGTLATWLRENPQAQDVDETGLGDADEFGMSAMAHGFLRMYYELLKSGAVKRLEDLTPGREDTN